VNAGSGGRHVAVGESQVVEQIDELWVPVTALGVADVVAVDERKRFFVHLSEQVRHACELRVLLNPVQRRLEVGVVVFEAPLPARVFLGGNGFVVGVCPRSERLLVPVRVCHPSLSLRPLFGEG